MMARSNKGKKRARVMLRRAYSKLGHLRGEDDPNLAVYYVGAEMFVERALSYDDPAIFYRGPKGVGKSAVLKMVELKFADEPSRIIRITPDDLAFAALANIDASTPVVKKAAHTQWLFKSLWNYIISIRLLQREYPTRQSILDSVVGLFRSEEQRAARKLLATSFADDGSIEPTLTGMLIRLVKEIEVAIESGEAKGSATVALDQDSQKGRQQLQILNLIDQVAKALPRLLSRNYFVLIDDLDLHWTNDPLENAVIAALFTSMAKLRNTTNVKFIAALREDIYRQLPIEDKDKSRDWLCDVFWDRQSIREMLEARMATLHNVSASDLWESLLPPGAFETLIEHSMMRPREIIRQLQLVFESAVRNGHPAATITDMDQGLRRFSQERLEELEQEWGHQYPDLTVVASQFTGRTRELSLGDVTDIAERAAIAMLDKVADEQHWIVQLAESPRRLAGCLIRTGFLVGKLDRKSTPDDGITPEMVGDLPDPYFAIRPVYCPGLGIVNT